MTCYSGSDFRDSVLTGMAQAFFAQAYADYVERDDPDLPRPGPGEDWMDFLPPLPGNAWAMAGELWKAIERLNTRSMYTIAQEIEAAVSDPDWHDFGFCLAMQAMGTGVAWADNHPDHGLQIPWIECAGYSFGSAAYYPEE